MDGSDQAVTSARGRGYEDVGDAVAGVLRAAEEAAETIRREARTQAVEIVERAQDDASARIADLTRDAERTRSDAEDYADDIRAAVDSYGTQQRREAEEEARQIVADAQEQAQATREAAQEIAREMEADLRIRHGQLREELRSLEERKGRILTDLRELAAQLDDLIPELGPAGRKPDLLEALEVEQRS